MGPTGVIDLIRAKEETAMGSLLQKLARSFYGTAPQNTSIDTDPITTALGSTTSTYAGITRTGAGHFWVCGNGDGPTALAANLSLANMQTEYGRITFGNEEPDTILATQKGFNAYWALLVGNIRYIKDEETTRAGFKRHLMMNNAVVLHDQFVPSQEMQYLNTKYVFPCFHVADYFVVDPFIRPSNQRVLSSFIWVTWNVKFVNPRMCQRVTSVTDG